MNDTRDKVDKTLDSLIEYDKISAQRTDANNDKIFKDATKVIVILTFAAFGVAIGFGAIIALIITSGIKKGVKFAEAIGEGDLTRTLEIDQNDEIGMLAKALNKSVENMRHIISEISVNTGDMSASSEELTAIVEEILSKMENESISTSEIAASMEETSTITEEINASEEEISGSTDELAYKAEKGNSAANVCFR